MKNRKFKIVLMIAVAVIAVTTLVMLLWNALLPAIFGVKSIGFFQALGLLILSKILFGGFRGHGLFGRHRRELREHWMAMSPEEREAFIKQRGRGRWHGCCSRKDRDAESRSDEGGQA
ncbi:hypothetical protein N5923_19900 [Erwiniaceae bacterium BAC15a-03b]|uniref:Uncharacterized protein n=1 Tax=Winslowiella arboricola TaxID=2978220 RepID=A0A9J6PY20_9GAMM|nr:hypothetical protein [Winslowiella arboricola]MCU5772450.1 hypothetical protein [Winslowiella arboricola]MCU5779756.1 hypothetical protein [Winslowiella arboricola]